MNEFDAKIKLFKARQPFAVALALRFVEEFSRSTTWFCGRNWSLTSDIAGILSRLSRRERLDGLGLGVR
jgi:hypothetical protein